MSSLSVVKGEPGASVQGRRPQRRRPSLAHVLIVIVAALAFGLNYLALQDQTVTVDVAVATRSIPAGSVLTEDAVRMIPIPADFAGLDSLIDGPEVESFKGWVVSGAVAEGGLLTVDNLVKPGLASGLRTMSVPIDREHAVGGSLVVGDRIDVISSSDGVPTFVVTDVEVVDVASADGGSFTSGGDYYVVVAVDADQALALASAHDSGSTEIIRSTGAPKIAQGVGVDDS